LLRLGSPEHLLLAIVIVVNVDFLRIDIGILQRRRRRLRRLLSLLLMWQGRAWLCKVHLARRRPMLVLVLALVLALALTLALAQIQDVRQVQKFEKALCVRVLVVVNSAPGRKFFPEGALWRRRALEIILQGRKKKRENDAVCGGEGKEASRVSSACKDERVGGGFREK